MASVKLWPFRALPVLNLPYDTAGVSRGKHAGRNVASNNTARSDHGPRSNADTTKDECARSDPNTLFPNPHAKPAAAHTWRTR